MHPMIIHLAAQKRTRDLHRVADDARRHPTIRRTRRATSRRACSAAARLGPPPPNHPPTKRIHPTDRNFRGDSMSSIKLKPAVCAVSIASAAAGSALLTEATALANAIPHGPLAQPESPHVLRVQPAGVRVQPDFIRFRRDLRLRRGVQRGFRRVQPEVLHV